jgi:hypothetical protein
VSSSKGDSLLTVEPSSVGHWIIVLGEIAGQLRGPPSEMAEACPRGNASDKKILRGYFRFTYGGYVFPSITFPHQ